MEVQVIKQAGGQLRPANQTDADALAKVRNGSLLHIDYVQPRNAAFHRKYFAMLNFAYEYWNPPELEYKGIKSEKNFERFRKEVAVLAGHYTVTVDLKGSVKLEPKSISFAKMDEDEFQALYKSVFDILWKLILRLVPNMTEAIAHNTIHQMLNFD